MKEIRSIPRNEYIGGIILLSLDKNTFFSRRSLPERSYYYSYNGKTYEITKDYVINSISSAHEEKCLFLLNELEATDDFIVNVYLQDLAEKYMQDHLRYNLKKEIEHSLIVKGESYKFTLTNEFGKQEYIAYQDQDGRYHVDRVEQVGIFAGWARYNKFYTQLASMLRRYTFDCERIEKPDEVNE